MAEDPREGMWLAAAIALGGMVSLVALALGAVVWLAIVGR